MTDILSRLHEKARKISQKVLLPEANDERIMRADQRAHERNIAQPVVFGVVFDNETVGETAADLDINLDAFKTVDIADKQITAYDETYAATSLAGLRGRW